MAIKAVTDAGLPIRVACQAFRISESCYRYESKLDAENQEVANWLIRLTDNHRSWGFGLCYLYLRNVRGFKWNHKRVYRSFELGCNAAGPITWNGYWCAVTDSWIAIYYGDGGLAGPTSRRWVGGGERGEIHAPGHRQHRRTHVMVSAMFLCFI